MIKGITIAQDIVYHFAHRGYLGKGMMIAVDKFTAVSMHERVQRLWKDEIKKLVGKISKATNEQEKQRLKKLRDYMSTVEMAVVISEEADEEKKFHQHGLTIKPHRDRINLVDGHGHDIETNFKDPEHPLQLVFVCAMWLTGFDVPTLSTLYLDKPMKDHTLMQAITRANRVTGWQINGVKKENGEVVDYYNVFRNMKKALKDYGQGQDADSDGDEDESTQVQDKSALFALLDDAIEQGLQFCRAQDVRLDNLLTNDNVFAKLSAFDRCADTLLGRDQCRQAYCVHQNLISSLYEACKPEVLSRNKGRIVAVFEYLRGVIDSKTGQADISAVAQRISDLLDESVVVVQTRHARQERAHYGVAIHQGRVWDLSKMDFDKLKEEFKDATYKNIEITDLRTFIADKLAQMLAINSNRTDFALRFQTIIDKYNAGGSAVEDNYDELVNFAAALHEEEERHIREGLSEDELELFDLLKKDGLTKAEQQEVKLAAKSLLHRLLEEQPKVLVQDWFRDQQTKSIARGAVETVLHRDLPKSYDRVLFRQKCDSVFDLMFDYASQGKKWAGQSAARFN